MGGLSMPHLMLLVVVVLIVFGGKGRISDIMGDVGKGLKAFKTGLADGEPVAAPATERPRAIEHQAQSVLVSEARKSRSDQ